MASSGTNSVYLFVYGTLLTTQNKFGLFLAENSRFVSNAKIKGRLYDIGQYPGIVPDAGGSYAKGKVFELSSEIVFDTLDGYEGISAENPAPYEYARILLPVETESETLLCWVYLYNWPIDKAILIEDGDWMRHVNQKQ
ncbi:MAG: gamma-glutamylcyclotransferase [Sphingobacteriaceae bacterium]|nr:MAG: gamma-glutamylcyclotransferase [Sphingobacteriaceae bacterium]